jgi:hypothetical protein
LAKRAIRIVDNDAGLKSDQFHCDYHLLHLARYVTVGTPQFSIDVEEVSLLHAGIAMDFVCLLTEQPPR